MHANSFFNDGQKWHFLINRFIAVLERCNTSAGVNRNINHMHRLLLDNGYPLQRVNRALVIAVQKHNTKLDKKGEHNNESVNRPESTQPDPSNKTIGPVNIRKEMGKNPLKIPFLSETFDSKVRKLVNELNLPFRVVGGKARQVNQIGVNPAPQGKCRGRCQVCRALPESLNCKMGNVVYEASCKVCDGRYIGKTSRNLYGRLSQHKSELQRMDERGPLPAHLLEHGRATGSLLDFKFDVMARAHGGVETAIKEALCIDMHRPAINRKEEKQFFM